MTTGTEVGERAGIPSDTFEARLMLARLHAGRLSIRQAADRCGYNNESWSGWERGRQPYDKIEVAEVVAEKLGVDRDWLLFGGPLAKEERRPGRVLTKKGAYAPVGGQPANGQTCMPTRPSRPRPTPASQGSPRLMIPVKHSSVTRLGDGPASAATGDPQRRTRRRNRPAA